jgi:hypothetical protein
MAMETFDQTKSQRDDIDKFIEEIKAVAKGLQDNPLPPPRLKTKLQWHRQVSSRLKRNCCKHR